MCFFYPGWVLMQLKRVFQLIVLFITFCVGGCPHWLLTVYFLVFWLVVAIFASVAHRLAFEGRIMFIIFLCLVEWIILFVTNYNRLAVSNDGCIVFGSLLKSVDITAKSEDIRKPLLSGFVYQIVGMLFTEWESLSWMAFARGEFDTFLPIPKW